MIWSPASTDLGIPFRIAFSTSESSGSRELFRAAHHAESHLRILAQIVPEEEIDDVLEVENERSSRYTHRPSFSLPLMTNNFRRFNARYNDSPAPESHLTNARAELGLFSSLKTGSYVSCHGKSHLIPFPSSPSLRSSV